jgi:uncharacterized protein (TIGR02266 family)
MGYSSATEAREARESLSKALEALQQDAEVPEEVLGITQNVAKSIGALFEAEYASTEPDGKTCVKSALGTLSQTLALLQDVKSEHEGVGSAIENIADVISILFPLTNKPSVIPDSASGRPPRASSGAPSAKASSAPPPKQSSAPPANVSSAPPPKVSSAPPAKASSAPPAKVSSAPPAKVSSAPPKRSSNRPAFPSTMLPPPAPTPTGERTPVEANLGATTQSNFYVGFTGEIAHGGVFLATYEALPKDTSVRMLVTLPGGFEFECDGYVRFVRDPMDFMSESEPGMGIQFEGLPNDARDLVLRFIRKRPPIFYDV